MNRTHSEQAKKNERRNRNYFPENGTINGRYLIVEKLGKGGMGTVFLVKDKLSNNQQIALKQIDSSILDKDTLKTFKQEFEVMTRLKHPNLIRVYDFGHDCIQNIYYITMEYIDGLSLADILNRHGALPQNRAVEILVDLCRALSFIHSRKIIHRDINPNNIMFTKDRIVKIMDFGLADLGAGDKRKKGTLYYMAPEIFQGMICAALDIFALGISFYQMLTNESFYSNYVSQFVINLIRNEDHFNNHQKQLTDTLSDSILASVILKMTAYNADNRYQSCTEIITDINQLLHTDFVLETEETREAYVRGAGFSGRDTELQKLKEKIQTPEGFYCALWVQGEAGIGKSRLFYEFKNWCQMNGIAFLEGSCIESIHKLFGPFLSIFGELLLHADTALLQKYGPELKKILPHHDALKQINASPAYDPQTERFILVRAIVESLIDCTRRYTNGCALYLNDMHWSDEGSIEVVDALLKEMKLQSDNNINFRLYLSSRIEGIEALEKIETKQQLHILRIQPFDEQYVEKYIESVFNETAVGTELRNAIPAIHAKVGGNPFFLQELVNSLITNKILVRTKQCWNIVKPLDLAGMPQDLTDLILSRLERLHLDDHEQEVLQIVALLNRTVLYKELHQIIAVNISFLQYLEQIEILKSEYLNMHIGYRIAHDIIREVIIKKIQHPRKLHERIASRLEIMHEKDLDSYVEELAYHYVRAENRQKAQIYLERAAEKTKNMFENEKAISFFESVLNLPGQTDHRRKIDILSSQGEIYWTIGELGLSIEKNKKAARMAESINDYPRASLAYYWIGFNLIDEMDHSSLELLEKCLTLSRMSEDKKMVPRALNALGYYYFFLDRNYEKASQYYRQGIKAGEEFNDLMGLYCNMGNLAQIYYVQGDFVEAVELSQKVLDLIGQVPDYQRDKAFLYAMSGSCYSSMRQYNNASVCFQEAIALSRKIGNIQMLAEVLVRKIESLFEQKLFSEARNILDELMEFKSKVSIKESVFRMNILDAKIMCMFGDIQGGVKKLIDLSNKTTNRYETAELMYELWCMSNETSYRDRARRLYEDITAKTSDYFYKKRLAHLKQHKNPRTTIKRQLRRTYPPVTF